MGIKRNGFTTVELMISFVIVGTIVVTMLMTILSIREAQYAESIYGTVMIAKSSVTKHIQDDLTQRKINTPEYIGTTLSFSTDDGDRTLVVEKNCITYLGEKTCLPLINEDDSLLVYDLANIQYSVNAHYLIFRVPILHPDLEESVSVEIIAPLS